MRLGDLVVAVARITDTDCDGATVINARPCDLGVIVGLHNRECPTVRFEREGASTVTDCAPGVEIVLWRGEDLTVGKPARE